MPNLLQALKAYQDAGHLQKLASQNQAEKINHLTRKTFLLSNRKLYSPALA
jgi:hypothetical protein